MRKFIALLFIMVMTPLAVFALENNVFNVSDNRAYILLVDDTAMDIQISDPKILCASSIVTLDSDKQQVLIQTLSKGSTSVTIKTPSAVYNYKFNVIENPNEFYDGLIELDLPGNEVKQP